MNVTFALESSFSAAKLPFNDSEKWPVALETKVTQVIITIVLCSKASLIVLNARPLRERITAKILTYPGTVIQGLRNASTD